MLRMKIHIYVYMYMYKKEIHIFMLRRKINGVGGEGVVVKELLERRLGWKMDVQLMVKVGEEE